MMGEKRAANLTQFIHNQTKSFREELQAKYLPSRLQYFHSLYSQLADCYHKHITPIAEQSLDSAAMMDYYACYKRTLRSAKDNNKRLYDEALKIEVKLKQCIEIKSTVTKSTADFQNDRQECYDDFAHKYDQLYASIFASASPSTIAEAPQQQQQQEKKK